MIIELIAEMLSGLVVFILDLFPSGSVPEWLGEGTYLTDVFTAGAGLGAWVPWSLFGTVSAFVLGSIAVGFGIRIVRILASFFLAGGGSAG